ncbi:MAG: hypothetical protein U1E89_21000 [Burkholderiaceae bacterium]
MSKLSTWGLVLCALGTLAFITGSGLGLVVAGLGYAMTFFGFVAALLRL